MRKFALKPLPQGVEVRVEAMMFAGWPGGVQNAPKRKEASVVTASLVSSGDVIGRARMFFERYSPPFPRTNSTKYEKAALAAWFRKYELGQVEANYFVGESQLLEAWRGSGLGPHMYDALLRWATARNSWVQSDSNVSKHAREVWDHYAWKRKDVLSRPQSVVEDKHEYTGYYGSDSEAVTEGPEHLWRGRERIPLVKKYRMAQ